MKTLDPMTPAERACHTIETVERLTQKYNKKTLLGTAKNMGVPTKTGRWTKIEIAQALVLKYWKNNYYTKEY